MKKSILFLAFLAFFGKNSFAERKKIEANSSPIHSKHWFWPLPWIKGNPLLIHDIFIISFNLEKKFPSWIAYHLSPALLWGQIKAERKYVADPLLLPKQGLIYKNYKGSSRCDGKGPGYDKGHLAPLGSFKASPYIYQAQYLSNIVPQSRNLNQGPWRKLEERVRDFVRKGKELKILTGPIYGKEGNKLAPCWKSAQGKLQEIPIAYWKAVAFKTSSQIHVCAFLMPQKAKKSAVPQKYITGLKEIEKKTELTLLSNQKPILQSCKFLFP